MNTEYADMAPAALAGPRYVRLWIDEASGIGQADPLPAGLDKNCVASRRTCLLDRDDRTHPSERS